MDIVVVNQNKIKLTLTPPETERYKIGISNQSTARELGLRYWGVIDDAGKKQGFFPLGERMLVQGSFTESGAEIYVTKLGKSTDASERTSVRAQNTLILTHRRGVYPFSKIDDLIDAVLHVKDCEEQKSSLYYSEDGIYYLFCEERSVLGVCSYLYTLSEFSKPLPPLMNTYVIEHSKCIVFENAVSLIKDLFGKTKKGDR